MARGRARWSRPDAAVRLLLGEAAGAGVQPPARGDRRDHDDLLGSEHVRHAHRDRAVVRAAPDLVLVVERYVDHLAGHAALGYGRERGAPAADGLAEGVAEHPGDAGDHMLLLPPQPATAAVP